MEYTENQSKKYYKGFKLWMKSAQYSFPLPPN